MRGYSTHSVALAVAIGTVVAMSFVPSSGFVDAWKMGGTGDNIETGIDVLGSNVYTTGGFEGSGDFDAFVSRVTD